MKKRKPDRIEQRPDVLAIRAEQRALDERQRSLVNELMQIAQAHTPPGPDREVAVADFMAGLGRAAQQEDGHAKAVNAKVAELFGGRTPAGHGRPGTGREEQIRVELEAIDIVLRARSKEYEKALSAAAADWVRVHMGEWRELSREWTLTATKLFALETRARAMADEIRGQYASGLPMTQHLGWGLSLLGIGDGDPLKHVKASAVAESICTTAEIREVENAF